MTFVLRIKTYLGFVKWTRNRGGRNFFFKASYKKTEGEKLACHEAVQWQGEDRE